MRFRSLELVRYGAFADRVLDFGDGEIDLHIVFGPNEAGKSTMLQGVGDFLFGIHPQSSQNWRYEHNSLRIRAVLEHDGTTLDLTRRKGKKNTLLLPDGSAADDDVVSGMLGGMDRAFFERMFGLDHRKLRDGGQAILEGRDDAARVVLEAGTGLSGIGAELKRLDDEAAKLFKPSAQNPVVNRLMSDREKARAAVREALLGEADWKAVQDKLATAVERRRSLMDETGGLARRAAMLERVTRVRPSLARLRTIDEELASLAEVRILPVDTAARVSSALSARSTANAVRGQHEAVLRRATEALAAVTVDADLLSRRQRLEELDERRPVVENALRDLTQRRGDLERVDAVIDAARLEARLPTDAPLPRAGWLERARRHLEIVRALDADETRIRLSRSDLHGRLAELGAGQGERTDIDLTALRAAISAVPSDFALRMQDAKDLARQTSDRIEGALAGLAPWRGTASEIVRIPLPPDAVVKEHGDQIETARKNVAAADAEVVSAEARALSASADVERLIRGEELPTAAAIAASRAERDAHLLQLREQILEGRTADVPAGLDDLQKAIQATDVLVDRRDADAKRIAEHALASGEFEKASKLAAAAAARRTRWVESLSEAEARWTAVLEPLGFGRPLPPIGVSAWRAERDRCVVTLRAAEDAAQRLNAQRSLETGFADSLRQGLEAVGRAPLADGVAGLLAEARTVLSRLEGEAKAAEAQAAQRQALVTLARDVERDEEELRLGRARCAATSAELLTEAQLPHELGDVAVSDAVSAMDAIASHAGTRASLARQVAGMERDVGAFVEDATALISDMARQSGGSPTDDVRTLAAELRNAISADEEIVRQRKLAEDAIDGLRDVDGSIREANGTLDDAMRLAGVATDHDLHEAIRSSDRILVLRSERSTRLEDLVALGDGLPLDMLRAEATENEPDAATAELISISARRGEIEAEREAVGRVLAEAEAATAAASSTTMAAEAQQRFVDTSAELASAAEAHVGTVARAAVLRWVVERNRAYRQAPLIQRASEIFATVTRGAFTGLSLGYSDDDEPSIRASRPGGDPVFAEGMSEGTRDQLYLALRLASIRDRSGVPLPLICDDLLITADESRSGAMIEVLAAAASVNQVILFTHHEHIVDVARRAIGEDAFRLHRLAPVHDLVPVE